MRSVHRVFALIALFATAFEAAAHTSLEKYIQHRLTLDVGKRDINLTIEISFNAADSYAERLLMDQDKNGTISSDEKKQYLESVAKSVSENLKMTIDGAAVRLVALYDPDLDFFDSKDLERHPHVLRMRYFVRTPDLLKTGSVIQLNDGLWTDKPAMIALNASGSDGNQIAVDETGNELREKTKREDRILTCRCNAVPKQSNAKNPTERKSP